MAAISFDLSEEYEGLNTGHSQVAVRERELVIRVADYERCGVHVLPHGRVE
jgi:hypothetical protein